MSFDNCFINPEAMRACEDRMSRELGWIASHKDSTKWVEGKNDSAESFDRSPNVQNPYDTQGGRNPVAAPLPKERFFVDPFAAHDAGTCGCKSLFQIEASLRNTAAENGFTLTPSQLEEHAMQIDAINRKAHLYKIEQTDTRASGSVTHSKQHQRGECSSDPCNPPAETYQIRHCPPLAPAPPRRHTAGIVQAPCITTSSSGNKSNSGALPRTTSGSEQYVYDPSTPGSRADRRPRG